MDYEFMDCAEFCIAPEHPALAGHFPGRPVVPGVVILDRVLAAIESVHGPLGAIRLPQVKFAQPLLPGQSVRIALQTIDARRWRFRVLRGDTLLASGEIGA